MFSDVEWSPYGTIVKMSTGKVPVYILIPNSDDDEKEIFKAFAEAGPMMKIPNADTLKNAFGAILHGAMLDGSYWLK